MGKVFDIYFKFGVVGDKYLGRCLAGLNPNHHLFGTLPPHFTVSAEHPVVQMGLIAAFGGLLGGHPDSIGVFILCLASMVYHSNFLLATMAGESGHSCLCIPLLQDSDLVKELKELVTIDGEESGMIATGVPPHVHILKGNEDMKEQLKLLVQGMDKQNEMIVATVRAAVNENDIRSGLLTLNTLEEKLKSHSENIGLLLRHELGAINPDLVRPQAPLAVNATNLVGVMYSYDGRFWSVPEGFVLPKKADIFQAFVYWFSGIPEYRIPGLRDNEAIRCSIMPFWKFKLDMLLKAIRQTFRLDYLPCMKQMEKYLESENLPESPSRATLKEWFEVGVRGLRAEVEYVFAIERWSIYTVGNMSKKLKYLEILKHGTDGDKRRAGERNLTYRNSVRKTWTRRR